MSDMVVIPKNDLSRILPIFIKGMVVDDLQVSCGDFPKKWVKEEVNRFKKKFESKLSAGGEYMVHFSELKTFIEASFDSLLSATLMSLIKSKKVEIGVDEDGQMTFWLKDSVKSGRG